ncbi:MAG: GNAT family N-acetyltransferase [Lachnospiraceae bacterium]|nr:GNAT family N-acetyltransferase [Lachnospiraceae bacterium]
MQVIEYFSCDRPEYWLSQIGKSDWEAGKFLHELLSKKILSDIVGEHPKVLMLTNGDELISFCTYSEKDDIQPTLLTPWMGFVYTFPQYRGHRYVGKLFQEIEKIAKAENVHDIFISTNHTGLYEKYGCEFYQMMNDVNDEPSRVYRKHIDNDN